MSRSKEQKTDSSATSKSESVESDLTADQDATSNSLNDIVISAWNIDLLFGASEDFEKVDWYNVAVTTFHIGVFSLIASSAIVFTAYLLEFLTSSPSLLSTAKRLFTAGSIVPLVLAVYGIISRWSWRRMDDSSPTDGTLFNEFANISIGRRSSLLLTSLSAISLALVFRVALYHALSSVVGDSMEFGELFTIVILDGIYLGLLLMGIGGLATLILEPDNHVSDPS